MLTVQTILLLVTFMGLCHVGRLLTRPGQPAHAGCGELLSWDRVLGWRCEFCGSVVDDDIAHTDRPKKAMAIFAVVLVLLVFQVIVRVQSGQIFGNDQQRALSSSGAADTASDATGKQDSQVVLAGGLETENEARVTSSDVPEPLWMTRNVNISDLELESPIESFPHHVAEQRVVLHADEIPAASTLQDLAAGIEADVVRFYLRDMSFEDVPVAVAVRDGSQVNVEIVDAPRTWISKAGNQSVVATLVGCVDGKVRLKRQQDSRIATISLTLLSADDQEYVRKVIGS